ncbi:gluconate 2-dehydrogenase subunit 3 family protein [Ruegeria sp. R13_0]|uniref:gluconate 2-dehydrogenase subunit 3 family protein n=1 Tax=Ruegeria sp. R13_0 TaxID=2821099 RepID=UPI001ADBA8FE|nr:gluconate 2-dehydrogenase subunit 3 family protein [Ruegeria sp. R13_0]MBO9433727.1 gluconate 2-dehydrogenase subunit 3 family protein [Ruegeria sp. R13_0]
MIGRRHFLTRVIPTTFWTSFIMRSLSRNAEAKTVENESYKTLTTTEAETLGAWCAIIVSGAGQAGVARFVDENLAGDQAASLLLLRYLDASDMAGFYRNGISGIEKECQHRFGLSFARANADQRLELVEAAIASKMQVWTNPNPNFFYFISRSDAVDVVYGTQAGFADLNIPYLAHIPPPRPW